MVLLLFALCLTALLQCHALDIVARDGTTYRDCEVSKVEKFGLRFVHKSGVAYIDFDDLPPALQRTYGWTPEKSAALKLEKEQHEAELAARDEALAQKAQAERNRDALAQRQAAEAMARAEQARADERRAEQIVAENQEKDRARAAEEAKKQTALLVTTSIVLMGIVSLFFYFLPTIVGRNKANAGAIFVLNLFLGWTFIGWVLALVWACMKDAPGLSIVQNFTRHTTVLPPPPPPVPAPAHSTTHILLEEEPRAISGKVLASSKSRLWLPWKS